MMMMIKLAISCVMYYVYFLRYEGVYEIYSVVLVVAWAG